MHPETWYKPCKFCENCARDTPLRGVYIPYFDQISAKISVLGVLYPYRCTDGVKFGVEEWTFGPFLHAKFHHHRSLSNLNTGAICAHTIHILSSNYTCSCNVKPHVSRPIIFRHRNGTLKHGMSCTQTATPITTNWHHLQQLLSNPSSILWLCLSSRCKLWIWKSVRTN